MKLPEESADILKGCHRPRADPPQEPAELSAGDLGAPRRRRHPPLRRAEDHRDLRDAGEKPPDAPSGPRGAVPVTGELMQRPTETSACHRAGLGEDPAGGLPGACRDPVALHPFLPELPEECREAVELTPLDRHCGTTEVPDGVPEARVLVDGRATHGAAEAFRQEQEGSTPPVLALPLGPCEHHGHGRGVCADWPYEDHIDGHPLPAHPEPEGIGDGEEGP